MDDLPKSMKAQTFTMSTELDVIIFVHDMSTMVISMVRTMFWKGIIQRPANESGKFSIIDFVSLK